MPFPWQAIKPVLYSLAAFSAFAVAMGVFVLPRELAQILGSRETSITHFLADEEHGTAFVIYRQQPVRAGDGIVQSAGFRRLDSPSLDAGRDFPSLAPNCVIRSGEQLYVGEQDGTIRSCTAQSGYDSETLGRQPDDPVSGLAVSPEGRWLLSWGESLYVWDLQSKRLLRQLPFHSTFALLSQNSNRYLCDDPRANRIVERDLQSGEVIRTLVEGFDVRAAAVSPDGVHLALLGSNACLRMLDLPSGETLWTSSIAGETGASQLVAPIVHPLLSFSANGERLVGSHEVADEWGLSVWKAGSGELETVLSTDTARIVGVSFCGSNLFYCWSDKTLQKWDLSRSTARPVASWNTTNWRIRGEDEDQARLGLGAGLRAGLRAGAGAVAHEGFDAVISTVVPELRRLALVRPIY
jgi:hypothetical protein